MPNYGKIDIITIHKRGFKMLTGYHKAKVEYKPDEKWDWHLTAIHKDKKGIERNEIKNSFDNPGEAKKRLKGFAKRHGLKKVRENEYIKIT